MSPKSVSSILPLLLVLLAATIATASIGLTSPGGAGEAADLNAVVPRSGAKAQGAGHVLPHRDEDLPSGAATTAQDPDSAEDVELLESAELTKDSMELEERFKGNGLHIDTDTFEAADIEVSSSEGVRDPSKDLTLTMLLVLMAIVSIGLYVAMVLWRSHLERRYGMRELLVTNECGEDDDDYFRPSSA